MTSLALAKWKKYSPCPAPAPNYPARIRVSETKQVSRITDQQGSVLLRDIFQSNPGSSPLGAGRLRRSNHYNFTTRTPKTASWPLPHRLPPNYECASSPHPVAATPGSDASPKSSCVASSSPKEVSP